MTYTLTTVRKDGSVVKVREIESDIRAFQTADLWHKMGYVTTCVPPLDLRPLREKLGKATSAGREPADFKRAARAARLAAKP